MNPVKAKSVGYEYDDDNIPHTTVHPLTPHPHTHTHTQ